MNPMIRAASCALILLSGCVGVSPHDSPSSITDAEIAVYRLGMKTGCTDQGVGLGHDPKLVEARCTCILDALKASLTHEEWQALTFASQKRKDGAEQEIFAKHRQQIAPCR